MTPENFVYWLQGWFELNDTIDHREGATPETLEVIREHLKLVFKKETCDGKLIPCGLKPSIDTELFTGEYFQKIGTMSDCPKVYYQQPANSC